MNVFYVEDEKDKRDHVKSYLQKKDDTEVFCSKSYLSAKNKLLNMDRKYDLLIMDMMFPDARDKQDNPDRVPGIDLIFDLLHNDFFIPTVILTRYTDYVNGVTEADKESFLNDRYGEEPVELSENEYDCRNYDGVHDYLRDNIPFYIGIIYFSNQTDSWKENLSKVVESIRIGNL